MNHTYERSIRFGDLSQEATTNETPSSKYSLQSLKTQTTEELASMVLKNCRLTEFMDGAMKRSELFTKSEYLVKSGRTQKKYKWAPIFNPKDNKSV